MIFTHAELTYLTEQRLGRLATVSPVGDVQNNPVGSAVALTDVDPPLPYLSREIIRLVPATIITWGLDGPRSSRKVVGF
ncbi:pyridoxamine 5'-phosphate oxidase family protein [Kribbella aluminosa]|uniref:Pyridoxamine 5'-phosphate oxidase family protein n=1 Tax=Kribbella aluminosa TaxID=416017 RepID=A0ABS4UW78_9ACTN|nr:hypothetical protein [Kribbella aluminosa]MBP2355897.1 pyridoxamine 5'-phosphate oxidase family protein [Kribbella aluminosa]